MMEIGKIPTVDSPVVFVMDVGTHPLEIGAIPKFTLTKVDPPPTVPL